MQSLRQYQSEGLRRLKAAWQSGKRAPIMVSPTGSGKTTMFAHLIKDFQSKRVLVLCPWRELVFQGHRRLTEHGVKAGIMMADRKPKEGETVHVATTATAARRNLGKYDLIVIDEAHRAVSNQCRRVINNYPEAKKVGWTATPLRLDGKRLCTVFDDLIDVVSVKDLINQGHLVGCKVYARDVDLAGLRYDRKSRDYATGSASKRMIPLVGDAVDTWRSRANGSRTLVFCVSIPHAEATVQAFTARGIKADMITGKTSTTRRHEMFEAVRAGELVLVSIGTCNEGLDLPELQTIVMLRPTLSRGLFRQICGRGLRPAPKLGKRECLFLDHADNFRKHGFPEDPVEWSLKTKQDDQKALKKEKFEPKAKKCSKCGRMVPMNTVRCPGCGNTWLPETESGKLVVLPHVPRPLRQILG